MTEFPVEGDADDADAQERFTPELRSTLARHYVRRAFIDPYYAYRPR